ncbi:MAG: transcription factor S [Desulfurococcaceae archaeon]
MPKFCPRCGGVMKPVKKGDEYYLACTRCGYQIKATPADLKLYGLTHKIEHSEREKTVVIKDTNELHLPITRDVTCPKCGYHEAYYWILQTRAADEPSTRFYKCRRCGYTWREYE